MTTFNGGQAFPMHWSTKEANINVVLEQRGMTLRDYFAAKAMQGYVSRLGFEPPGDYDTTISLWAYEMADSMLKAREA